ncbi:uncharacterized protein LOC130050969 [Ostrea edulis]|uniref:uncharacterized protein LOC130050969 n=1 Tax=Ostrea edulis TaxID=37623 RepID=UPI0024AFE40B|nr:uncharacterized protein LOC130050969 [Ostrea edulis]
MENKTVCQGNTRVHKPAKFNVNTRRMAVAKSEHVQIRLSKQQKSTEEPYQEMARMLGINKSPSLRKNKEFILDSCIEFIKRRKQEKAMYEKQEQKKIRMEALLKKMDIVLKVLELKWELCVLLEEMKASRARG